MDLQTTNKAIAKIQEALGLNPERVPELEFLVETFIVRNCITSDCIRIGPAENNYSQIGDETNIPCVDLIISSDDLVDGPGGRIYCFTYYHGDNIPNGPRHALIITDLVGGTLVYWRERNQNPAAEWIYNIFAKAQVSFKFTPQGNDVRFMTQRAFYELIRDSQISDATQPKATEYLKIDTTSKLLAEVAYLNFWNATNDNAPEEGGISFDTEFDYANSTVIVTISCDQRNDIGPLSFLYTIDADEGQHLNYYKLLILDDDNIVYDRRFDQNEATEWKQNSMADDPLITDEFGNPLFIGEPVRE